MIYYDVTDIINHAKFSTRVSGIQRVVLEGMKGLQGNFAIFFISPITGKTYTIKGLDDINIKDLSVFSNLWVYADIFISNDSNSISVYIEKFKDRSNKFKIVNLLYKIAKLSSVTKRISEHILKSKIRKNIYIEKRLIISELTSFKENSLVALFGGVWNFQGKYEKLFKERLQKVEKIFMVYDMIPIVSPFVPDELKGMFKKYIPFVLEHANKIIVNSDSCKKDLINYAIENGNSVPEIDIIHLSHKLPVVETALNNANPSLPLRTRKLSRETYALCVGSIESRKNHINLILTWTKFFNSEEYANQKLVIVGKWLWDTAELNAALTYTGHVSGSIIVIPDASDEEIAALYKNCRFTVYPSHYEGWGLPLGESLTAGKPCLHFDTSSLTEAGYGLTTAVEYLDYKTFNQQFKEIMTNDSYYEKLVKKINDNKHILRDWTNFSSDLHEMFIRKI